MTCALALVFSSLLLAFGMQDSPGALPHSSPSQNVAAPTGSGLAQAAPKNGENPPTQPSNPANLTDADRAANLKRAIEAAKRELQKLKLDEENPASEYRKAESEYQLLDARWIEQAKEIQRLGDVGKLEEAELLKAEQKLLKQQLESAKERFALLFQERKTLRNKAVALRTKLQQDQVAFDKLSGEPSGGAAHLSDSLGADKEKKKGPDGSDAKKEPTTIGLVAPPVSLLRMPEAKTGQTTDAKPPAFGVNPVDKNVASAAPAEPKPVPKELVVAQHEAKVKEVAAVAAKDKAKSITERVESLRKNIGLEEELLETARKKAEQANKNLAQLEDEVQKNRAIDPGKLHELTKQKSDTVEHAATAQDTIQTSQDDLNEMRTELSNLQQEQIAALRESEQKLSEAELAQLKVERLRNPFTVHNLLQWMINHGPKLATILLGAMVLHLLVRFGSHRIAQVVVRGGGRGTEKDRENRSLTLTGVVRNTAFLTIFSGVVFMILDEVGIPIMPLMGGAAVLGLAVAFGAQNLIHDYFSGFMVLMEDQYGINDVVRIGDVAGVVEKITLRMTAIRDLEGIVHFIPHGTITRVSNMTHGWSRALFSIGVAYREDPNRVMKVLMDLAQKLRQDPVLGPNILDDPEMLGVDSLSDSSVDIKFFLKTKPLQQWPIKRELLLRIKRKFDELGIEIPFPHRTIYHHYEHDDHANGIEQRRPLGRESAA